ncbi:MAG: GNAT family N-acetyltransferase [Candidatus Schekmanbacteria bacterium]|nr:GNAT family N-acetyltransferase [Candidatus Schekmanbacteria bacterium]
MFHLRVSEVQRRGIAGALVAAGESWLIAQGMATLATDTSDANAPLIGLFARRGCRITLRSPEARMVRLSRRIVPG